MKQFRTSEDERPTFEETYPRYEFAPLVTIALAVGGWLAGQRNRVKPGPRARIKAPQAPGTAAPAS